MTSTVYCTVVVDITAYIIEADLTVALDILIYRNSEVAGKSNLALIIVWRLASNELV